MAPLISMQLGGPTLDGLSMLFDQYVDMLIKAVPNPGEDEEGGAENGDDRKVGILEADNYLVLIWLISRELHVSAYFSF